jgi:hypothetical protein
MITKSKTWDLILEGFKEIQRSKKITTNVMNKIKELEADNVKDSNK